MTTIAPPPPPPPPTPTPAPAPVVVVPNAPPALAQLAIGSRITGDVLAQLPQGAVRLQTPAGIVDIQSPVPLPNGAQLLLSLQTQSPRVLLSLIAVNGGPPQAALRGPAAAPSAPGAPPATAPAAPTPAAAPAAAPAGPAPLAPGAALTATLIRPAALAGGPTPATAAPGAPTPTTAAPPAPGAAPAVAPAAVLAAGTRVPLRLVGIQPPAAGPAPTVDGPARPAPGQTVRGVVTGAAPNGQPVVRTPAGSVTLNTSTPLPRGTVLTLEVAGEPQVPRPAAVAASPAPLTRLAVLRAPDWPALREAVQVLREAAPPAAQALVETTLPKPGPRLGAALIFFLSALRGGDVKSWLGESATRVLARQRPELLARLGDDFAQLGRIAEDRTAGDWRVAQIPLAAEGQIEQIRMLLRHRGSDDDEDARGRKGTRFVVDVTLTRLGRMQLDGMVRNAGKRLDLIVRSERPLDAAMREDVRAIFRDAAAVTGLDGGVGFQAAPPRFVEIDAPAAAEPGVVV